MPTPIIVTVNVTLRILRWPTLTVAQPKAQAIPITSTPLAISACRTPPNPAMITIATAASDRPLAHIIDCALDRISSSSMIGSPVRPIVVSGCRAATAAMIRRSSSVAADAPAKPPSAFTSRRSTKPSLPSLASRCSLERSRSVESDSGMPGHGDTYSVPAMSPRSGDSMPVSSASLYRSRKETGDSPAVAGAPPDTICAARPPTIVPTLSWAHPPSRIGRVPSMKRSISVRSAAER